MLEPDETDFLCLATIPKSGTHYTHHFLVNYLLRIQGRDPGETLFSHDAYAVFPNRRRTYYDLKQPYLPTGPLPAGLRDLVVQHGFANLERYPGKVIALFRNPLDYIVSLYHYRHGSRIDESLHVDSIAEVTDAFATRWAIAWATLQNLLATPTPVLPVRYEDLVRDPAGRFRAMLTFAAVPIDQALLDQTIQDVQSDRFRTTAAEKNLNPNFRVPIARDGSIGQWRREMSEADVEAARQALARRRIDLDALMADWG
jgi:hypothetical protein